MTRTTSLRLLGLAGIAAGIAGAAALHAQGGQAPAYFVNEAHVIDATAYAAFLPKAKAIFEASGGQFIARGGKIMPLEGEAPERVAIFRFPSMEQAQAFFASQAHKDLVAARGNSATVRQYVVEGLTP